MEDNNINSDNSSGDSPETANDSVNDSVNDSSSNSLNETNVSSGETSHREVFGDSSTTNSGSYYVNNNYTAAEEPVSNGFAIASLVMGILSILTCCCTITGILFGILGIIFYFVQAKDSEGKRPTQATIGLILSIIGIVIAIVSIAGAVLFSLSPTYQNINQNLTLN